MEQQLKFLKENGDENLNVYTREESVIIIYPSFLKIVLRTEKPDIMLRLRVINKKGVLHPTLLLNAAFNEDFTRVFIRDIDIKKDVVNKGYASILLSNLIQVVKDKNAQSITGWISKVDEEHIERLEHFYKKHNFKVTLDKESSSIKIGELIWKNVFL